MVNSNEPLLPDFDADFRATCNDFPMLSVELCELVAQIVERLRGKCVDEKINEEER